MKKFREYVSEGDREEALKDKHDRENLDLERKQSAESERAKEAEFEAQRKEREAKRREQEVKKTASEAYEIGTDEIVAAYKKATPNQ